MIVLNRKKVSEEDFLDDLLRVYKVLDSRTLTRENYDSLGLYHSGTIVRRFKSWNIALEKSGIPISKFHNITEKDLLSNIQKVWDKIGKQPVGSDMDKSQLSVYCLGTYEKRYGSWNKALAKLQDFMSSEFSPIRIPVTKVFIKKSELVRSINIRLRAKILIRDSCICKMCGNSPAKNPEITLHIDHIKPWSRGGLTNESNLRTLCSICNIGKNNIDTTYKKD